MNAKIETLAANEIENATGLATDYAVECEILAVLLGDETEEETAAAEIYGAKV